MSIKRYVIYAIPEPEVRPNGPFVSYDDHVAEVERLTADLAAARAERDQLAELVDDLTLQSTYGIQDEENGDGAETFDSGAISAFADGLRDMARRGKVRITHDVGRRVIAVFTDEELARREREVEEHRERFRAALAALPTPPEQDETPAAKGTREAISAIGARFASLATPPKEADDA